MWLRGPKNDGFDHKHICELPDLDEYRLAEYKRVERWRWMCPICGRVYRPRETEMGFGPLYEWVRLWPWTEYHWQKRSGLVF